MRKTTGKFLSFRQSFVSETSEGPCSEASYHAFLERQLWQIENTVGRENLTVKAWRKGVSRRKTR